jgi:signal transduction histidine kinase
MPTMESLSNASPGSRRTPGLGVALLLALLTGVGLGIALLAWAALSWALPSGAEPVALSLLLAVFGTALTLLLVGAVGWHVGVRLTRQRFTEMLRETRVQLQTMSQLQADWQWASDAQHHLVRWQAPQGATATSWVNTAATEAVWERFSLEDGPTDGLRQQLATQAGVFELTVQSSAAGRGRWHLRGIACWDGNGRFAGYLGTAHSLAAAAGTPLAVGTAGLSEGQAAAAGLVGAAAGSAVLPVRGDGIDHESFSYTVSHDLRAPLRVVDGFARILKEDYGRVLDRIGNDHLERVLGAAARMSNMIDALLSLSQLSAQPLARQPVNLSQMAGFVMEELSRSAPERLLDVHIQPHLVAQGDPTLLRMVLENLLGNAWKYSSKCQRTQIRFEANQEAEQASGQWIYRVCDNGAGFDMRFAERLFGVFQRLHSASDFQGTGVGLASVRRIVRRHGGEIWAEAEVGAGARFYFTLPG